MHEVYPGHYLHFQHLRQIGSKLRKSLMTMPMSVVEGWAHYAEHVMIEAGFDGHGGAAKLGQLAESLVRLARLVVAIRLHTEDWSVEQGVRFFRDAAFLEEGSARREAERGTFDPGYGCMPFGKLILLKLRKDVQAQQGQRFSLKAFHDDVLALGGLRYPLQRRSAARCGGTGAPRWSSMGRTPCPFRYEYEAENGRRFEIIQKFSDPNPEGLPDLRRPGPQADFLARDPVQGIRLLASPTTPRSRARRREGIEGLADASSTDPRRVEFDSSSRLLQLDEARRRRRPATPPSAGLSAGVTSPTGAPSWPGRP